MYLLYFKKRVICRSECGEGHGVGKLSCNIAVDQIVRKKKRDGARTNRHLQRHWKREVPSYLDLCSRL